MISSDQRVRASTQSLFVFFCWCYDVSIVHLYGYTSVCQRTYVEELCIAGFVYVSQLTGMEAIDSNKKCGVHYIDV